ncbi:MAG: ubiquinol-cytochrome c reductase iron-sulfur subunit [Anaerolineae bacterium]
MAEATMNQGQGITRREFLNYVWGAAISLFLAEFGIGAYIFSLPRFREGEFGSDFDLGALNEILPPPDSEPADFPQAKTWLLNIGPKEAAKGQGKEGLMAIYKVCTHLGCLYKFEQSTERFECPCHGSKFHQDGTKILQEGPAPRGLDRFIVELMDEAGNAVATTPENGDPLPLPANAGGLRVIVKTSKRILGGPPKPDPAA